MQEICYFCNAPKTLWPIQWADKQTLCFNTQINWNPTPHAFIQSFNIHNLLYITLHLVCFYCIIVGERGQYYGWEPPPGPAFDPRLPELLGTHLWSFLHCLRLPATSTFGPKPCSSEERLSGGRPVIKGDMFYHRVRVGLAVTSRLEKSASSDVTSGRVHLDVCWIDEQRLLQSTV